MKLNVSPTSPKKRPDPQWWRGGVIYQIYPRSFKDSNNDGVGDLAGIISKLDYIASLGVDAIWISPFFKSPMKDFGYDVSDYRDVDPLFGTLDDFSHLTAQAHELGLKVMIDQVLSHTSDQHPWFKQSRSSHGNPRADWYVWADPKPDGAPPNNWQSVFGGSAWQWDAGRRQYYLHNFLTSQPDLNFHHPAVQKQILEDMAYWCKRGVDGFRIDACNFHFHDRQLRDNPPVARGATVSTVRADNPYSMQQHRYDKSQPENLEFLKKIRQVLDKFGAVSVGEVGDEDALRLMAQYTAGPDHLHMAYSFNLLTEQYSAAHIRQQVEQLEANINPVDGWGCWSFSNHDVQRVMTRWHKGRGKADAQFGKMLLAMLGSLRGSLCVYQGEELGLTEAEVPFDRLQDPYGITFWPEFKGRDGCRTPIPWNNVPPNGGFSESEPWLPMPVEHLENAVSVQQADNDSILAFTRQFLAWRSGCPALRSGAIRFLDAPEPILMLERVAGPESPPQCILAAFNLGNKAVSVTLPASVTPMNGHGLAGGQLQGQKLRLAAHSGFFGLVTRS